MAQLSCVLLSPNPGVFPFLRPMLRVCVRVSIRAPLRRSLRGVYAFYSVCLSVFCSYLNMMMSDEQCECG